MASRRWTTGALLLAMLVVMGWVSANATSRGIMVTAKSEDGGTRELKLYSGYYALVIGCADYRAGWPRLRNPVKDAREVAEALKKIGFEVTLIENPDYSRLSQALTGLTSGPGADPEKGIFVFFAGHGHTLTRHDGTKLGYIVAVDAPHPEKDQAGFMSKSISMSTIEDISSVIKSKHVLMAFDSCFSGAIFRAADLKDSYYIREQVAKPVRAFIAAGDENERVPDDSVFKTCLIQGLAERYADKNKDGYVTGGELGLYLKEEVVNYSKGTQHPHFGKINNPKLDKGHFVFAGLTIKEPGKPAITVESNVTGAVVRLNGKEIGTTPLRDWEVQPGTHRVEVSKEGYETHRESVSVPAGKKVTHKTILKKITPARARLYVDTEPGEAVVKILNITPRFTQGMELDPGQYDLEVSAEGYRTKKERVTLAAGEEKRIDVRLDPVGPRERQKGDVWKDPVSGMEFVWVPGGCFQMGQTEEEKRYLIKEVGEEDYKKYFARELPRHKVCVDGFWMGKHEVTVGEWRKFVKETGYRTEAEKGDGAYTWTEGKWEKKAGVSWDTPGFTQTDKHPVTCMSWNDAKAFIEWMNKKGKGGFRLPTEGEWEYACRGGTTTIRFWGDGENEACKYANVRDQTSKRQFN